MRAFRAVRRDGTPIYDHVPPRAICRREERIAGVEHQREIDRSRARDGVSQRILLADSFKMRRLAVIPFHAVLISVGTDNAVLRRDLMPLPGFLAASAADAMHVDSQAVGV